MNWFRLNLKVMYLWLVGALSQKCMRARRIVLIPVWLALSPLLARELSPQQIFQIVSPSVVVVEVSDKSGNVSTGSGVAVPSQKKGQNLIATNCRLINTSAIAGIRIKQGKYTGFGVVESKDDKADLCVIRVFALTNLGRDGKLKGIELPTVRVTSSRWIEVGDTVYAIGAPRGLELALSDGLISGIGDDKGIQYIQTTAPVSPGSSGGGLFDAQARLVGITTTFLKESQAHSLAVPAELIASLPPGSITIGNRGSQVAATPPRGHWRTFYKDEKRECAIDTKTISTEGRKVAAWIRTRFSAPQRYVDDKTRIEFVSRETHYCGRRSYYTNQSTSWSDTGEIVGFSMANGDDIKVHDVLQNTMGETIHGEICREP